MENIIFGPWKFLKVNVLKPSFQVQGFKRSESVKDGPARFLGNFGEILKLRYT